MLCVAFAVTGFVTSASVASAARFHHAGRSTAHRAAGRPIRMAGSLRANRFCGRRAPVARRSAERGHEAGHRGHFASLRRHSHPHLARRIVGAMSRSAAATATSGAREQTGNASFYSGRGRTAGGGRVGAATCAHRTLPFGTKVLVTNLRSGRQAVLTVNDRGPFVRGRILDVSIGAAGRLGMVSAGTAPVRLQVLARAED